MVAAITAWAVVMSLALSSVWSLWPDAPLGTDFLSFWTGASLLRIGAGPSLYDIDAQRAFQQGLLDGVTTVDRSRLANWLTPYYNPPFLALLLVPLTWLSVSAGYVAWWGLRLVAFFGGISLPLRGYHRARYAALLMLTFGAVADNLIWGQVDALFLLVFSLGLMALTRGRQVLGGALLGFLWLKPQYAVLFPVVFLVKGRWRELAGMVAVGMAMAVLSFAMLGPEGVSRYLGLMREVGGFYPPAFSFAMPQIMVNWRGFLINRWPGISEQTGVMLMGGSGALSILLSLLAWRGKWDPSSPRFPRQMLVTAIATLLAIPHSHFHGLVLLLAPLGLAVARPMSDAALSWSWRPLLVVGYLLGFILWPFENYRWVMVPFFFVAMLVLVLQCWAGERAVKPTTSPLSWFNSTLPWKRGDDGSDNRKQDVDGSVE